MLSSWASYLLGGSSGAQESRRDTSTEAHDSFPVEARFSQVEDEDDDWILIDRAIEGATALKESWCVMPPACFTHAGPVHVETSPFEDLLIEHPSMSVFRAATLPFAPKTPPPLSEAPEDEECDLDVAAAPVHLPERTPGPTERNFMRRNEHMDEPRQDTPRRTGNQHDHGAARAEEIRIDQLHSAQKPIQDPDPVINCDLMDGRDAFLTMAREKHNQAQDKFVYTCNNCKSHVETRYHCFICDDFDLCISCKEKDGHRHHMEKLGLDLDDGSLPADAERANPHEVRQLSIQRCIQWLEHACQCRDANCRLLSCQRMKLVIMHIKGCKRKTNGGCPISTQLIELCCLHAKHCQETNCLVLYCSYIKLKLKKPQLQQRYQPNAVMQQNPGLRQQTPQQLMQQQQHQHQDQSGMSMGGQMPQQPRVIGGPVEHVGQDQGGSTMMHRHALQQLMQTLKSPHTPE